MKRIDDRIHTRISISESGCWEWHGGRDRNGYGRLQIDRRPRMAHRVSYELFVGPIPDGLELDHLCRVRHCINPAHLEPVTHRENVLRGDGWSGINARRTHCLHGHSLDDAYRIKTGKRRGRRCCRQCILERSRRNRQARKEAS